MKKIFFIIAILVCFIHAQAETTTLYSLVPTKALDTLTVPAKSTYAVYDECTGNATLSPSGTKAYCGAYVSNKSDKEYKITYGSSALSFGANQIWLIMYSPTPFQAGDSITIKGTSSTTPLGKLFFAEFDEFTTDYYGSRASDSIAMANVYFNPASSSYEYGAKLPAGFTSSNYLVLGRNGSSFSVKNLKITRESACTSHSVTAATNNVSYGTAAAASTTVCEGSTTTVTATPESGYSFVSWAVSGTGSSLSSTSDNPTTLTMGTADATVTVTFGCKAPTSPAITGTTAYTEGQDISLTASASDKSASATYTWYKGATWDAASATTPVQAASTSGASLSIADCVEDNAGTYWCNISNGTGCDVQASKAITVTGCSPSISASPSSANYCKDDVATALTFTGTGHDAQKWQYYDGDSWEDIDGATNATYTPSTSATGSTQYRVVTTCDSYTTTATSSAATVTVKTDPGLTITLN